jgi:hypothetical protein
VLSVVGRLTVNTPDADKVAVIVSSIITSSLMSTILAVGVKVTRPTAALPCGVKYVPVTVLVTTSLGQGTWSPI